MAARRFLTTIEPTIKALTFLDTALHEVSVSAVEDLGESFTLEIRMWHDSLSGDFQFVHKEGAVRLGYGNGVGLEVRIETATFETNTWSDVFTNKANYLERWLTYTVVRDAAARKTRLYLNGRLKQEWSTSGSMTGGVDRFDVGESAGPDSWAGRVAWTRVWNRALNDREVYAYHRWPGGRSNGLVLSWRCDSTLPQDLSGNGYHATASDDANVEEHQEATIRWSDFVYATEPGDEWGEVPFDNVLTQAVAYSRSIKLDQDAWGQLSRGEYGEMVAGNDRGALDWVQYADLQGAALNQYTYDRDAKTRTLVFSGFVKKVKPSLKQVTIVPKTQAGEALDRPVQQIRYTGFHKAVGLAESITGGTGNRMSKADAGAGDLTRLDGTDFTIEALVSGQLFAQTFQYIALKIGGADGWDMRFNRGALQFVLREGGNTHLTSPFRVPRLDPNRFYWMQIRFDDSELRLEALIDGEIIGSEVTANGVGPGAASLNVGFTSNFWQGRYAELRLWNDLRTDEELREHMHRAIPDPSVDDKNLVALWRFDAKSGTDWLDEGPHGYTLPDAGGGGFLTQAYEGRTDLAGQPMPLALGQVFNVAPDLVNAEDLVYRGHARACDWLKVKDSGGELTVAGAGIVKAVHQGFGAFEKVDPVATDPGGGVTADIGGDAIFSNALDFDGSTQYATVPDHADLDIGAGDDFSLEGWVKADVVTGALRTIFFKGPAAYSGSPLYRVILNSLGQFEVYLEDSAANKVQVTNSAGFIQAGRWHHVAFVLNRTEDTIRVYVDGKELPSSGNSAASLGDCSNANAFMVGARTGPAVYFDGSISGVRIWKEARTQDQIREYMLKEVPNAFLEDDLVLNLPFAEGEGAKVQDDTNGVHHATTTGSPPWVAGPYVDHAGKIAVRQLLMRQDLDFSLIDDAAFWQLDADAPYVQGWWGSTGDSIAGAITDLMSSVGAWWAVNRTGQITCKRITDPTSAVADYSIAAHQVTGEVKPLENVPEPLHRLGLGYKKNHKVLGLEDIVVAASDADKEELSQEWRVAEQEVDYRPGMIDKPLIPTTLQVEDDAYAECRRQLAIRSRPWQMFEVPVETAFEIDVGDIVELTFPRFGLDAGQNFLVLSVADDSRLRRSRLSLWRPI